MERAYKILVCALGRSGSSLCMQIFDAAGLRCAGLPPYWEWWKELEDPAGRWLEQFDVVKRLNLNKPERRLPAGYEYRALWLDRENRAAQCQSLIKKGIEKGKSLRSSKAFATMKWKKLISQKRAVSLGYLRDITNVIHHLTFEQLITDPWDSCQKLKDWFDLAAPVEELAAVVRPRGVEVLPDLLEDKLLEEHNAAKETKKA